MGRKEEVCGAVSGGIMVLGALYGRGENQDRSLTENTYKKTRLLIDKFIEKQGSVICRKLLDGCELLSPIGKKDGLSTLFRTLFSRTLTSYILQG